MDSAGREAGQLGQRPRRSAGRGCRRAARQQRGVAERRTHGGVPCGRAAQRGRACALEWGGDGAQQGSSGAAAGSASARGSGAASGRQRRSERERAHSSALRARRQRREDGGERKGTLVNDFDSIQNQNFQLKLEKL